MGWFHLCFSGGPMTDWTLHIYATFGIMMGFTHQISHYTVERHQACRQHRCSGPPSDPDSLKYSVSWLITLIVLHLPWSCLP